jgi:hypothetical protein
VPYQNEVRRLPLSSKTSFITSHETTAGLLAKWPTGEDDGTGIYLRRKVSDSERFRSLSDRIADVMDMQEKGQRPSRLSPITAGKPAETIGD